MKKTTIKIKVSQDLKDQSKATFNTIGLTTSKAIRIFLTQVVNSNGFPFEIHFMTSKKPTFSTQDQS